MAHIRADRALETSTTTGTGTFTVLGPVTGFVRLDTYLDVADTFDYIIFGVDAVGNPTGEWESGVGTYSATDQFTRAPVRSSNSDAVVNFSAGTKRVALTLTAAELGKILSGERRATITKSGTSENLLAADVGTYARYTNTSAKTVTVRPNATAALPTDGEWHIRNAAASDLTIVAGSGVTINVPAEGTLVVPPHGTVTLKRIATDAFDLFGFTVAA